MLYLFFCRLSSINSIVFNISVIAKHHLYDNHNTIFSIKVDFVHKMFTHAFVLDSRGRTRMIQASLHILTLPSRKQIFFFLTVPLY